MKEGGFGGILLVWGLVRVLGVVSGKVGGEKVERFMGR